MGYTFWLLVQVLAILFVCNIYIGIDDTFSGIFWQYTILSSGALVKYVNNITVSERLKATIVLHLK